MGETIPIASDHAGFQFKGTIINALREMGYDPLDLGTYSEESVDYPDYGKLVAEKVSNGEFMRGIVVCGSGIGISIVANKFRGVRAALCHSVEAARLSREHNDANILAFAGRKTPENIAVEMLETWLNTPFNGGRHQDRVEKISIIEENNFSD
jgi:ribose 5-phosphate isomerase B